MRCDCRHRLALLGSQRSTLLLTFNPFWLTRLTAVLAYVLSCSPFAETPEQMASHEVSPGFGSPSIRRGGAGGPGEGGLYRVRAVLREEGAPASPQLPPLLLRCWPSFLLLHGDFSPAEELSVLKWLDCRAPRDWIRGHPENWSQTWTHCSAPVGRELTYLGLRGGGSIDVIDSVSIG